MEAKFLRLYDISSNKEAKLYEIGWWINNSWVWNFQWRSWRFEWETKQVNLLLQEFDNIYLSKNGEDEWKKEKVKRCMFTR